MSNPDGKVVVITGAGRRQGIGRATAHRFAREGARLVLTDLDPEAGPASAEISGAPSNLAAIADEIGKTGAEVLAVAVDVAVEADVDRLIAAAVERFGRIDTMVTNAAIFTSQIKVVDLPAEVFSRVLSVNLLGTFLTARAAARQMIAQGDGGAIVTVGSRASRRGSVGLSAYVSSKFGVIGLSQSLALELAPEGIRVNCVCPGAVDTDMYAEAIDGLAAREGLDTAGARDKLVKTVPLGRFTTPDDVAAAIYWFATEESGHVTGQSLNVNGGTWLN